MTASIHSSPKLYVEKFGDSTAWVVHPSDDIVSFAKKEINTCFGARADSSIFPFPQPVTISRADLPRIKSSSANWVAVEKTEGVRYALLLCIYNKRQMTILVDRSWKVIIFGGFSARKYMYENTSIIDVELVQSNDKTFHAIVPLDIYQTSKAGAKFKIAHLPQEQRTTIMQEYFKETTVRRQSDINNAGPICPFIILSKEEIPLSKIDKHNFEDKLVYKSRGLILKNITAPVTSGADFSMIKIKDPKDQTIDCIAVIAGDSVSLLSMNTSGNDGNNNNTKLEAQQTVAMTFGIAATNWTEQDYLGGKQQTWSDAFAILSAEQTASINYEFIAKTLNGKVLELYYDHQEDIYALCMVREDKPHANSSTTVQGTKQSIRECVSILDLSMSF